MTKYSRQRELIYRTVMENRVHPTADFVYNSLKKELPNLSLGTVYRNLQQLAESGQILRLHIPDQPDRFDGDISPHYHSICSVCGKVDDVQVEYFKEIDIVVQQKLNVTVCSHDTIFKIICEKCGCLTN